MMDEELRGLLVDRIRRVCLALAKSGQFLILDATKKVIAELISDNRGEWNQIRDHFAEDGVARYVNRVLGQARENPDQQLLPFEDFKPIEGLEALPQIVTSDGAAVLSRELQYADYEAELKRLKRRIKSYEYKRRKPENLEHDRELLTQMIKFNPRFARYSKTEPDLPLWKAKQKELDETSVRNRKVRKAKRHR